MKPLTVAFVSLTLALCFVLYFKSGFSIEIILLLFLLPLLYLADSSSKKQIYLFDGLMKTVPFDQDYKVLKLLGRGSFAEVFLVSSRKDNKKRAVKVIKKANIKDTQQIQKEVKIWNSIDCPYVVKLFDVYEDEEQVCIVMEWLQGGELFHRLVTDHPDGYDENIVKEIIRKLTIGLKYLHRRGIIHRDLKPENILFVSEYSDSEIKITDFGLADIVHSGESLSLSCGSCRYVAPEVILGDEYSFPADIWSLGIIMFTLLCGYSPFDGDSEQLILRKIALGEFSFDGEVWKNISKQAKSLISNMLHLDPEDRKTASEILKHPWFQDVDPWAITRKTQLLNIMKFQSTYKDDILFQVSN
eukprot:gene9125-1214_t